MSVYFIRDDRGCVKIGHARDPWRRMQELQSASSDGLALIRVVDGGQKVELWFHQRFAALRVRGEWFNFAEEMLTTVAPDEIPRAPIPRAPKPYQSPAEFFREANRLGLLSERMKQDYAPLLGGDA